MQYELEQEVEATTGGSYPMVKPKTSAVEPAIRSDVSRLWRTEYVVDRAPLRRNDVGMVCLAVLQHTAYLSCWASLPCGARTRNPIG